LNGTSKKVAGYRIQGCGDLLARLRRGGAFTFEFFDAKTRASSVPIPADAPVIKVRRVVMHYLNRRR
jgi:hypothetical protein